MKIRTLNYRSTKRANGVNANEQIPFSIGSTKCGVHPCTGGRSGQGGQWWTTVEERQG